MWDKRPGDINQPTKFDLVIDFHDFDEVDPNGGS
jgi:hypothetical protein